LKQVWKTVTWLATKMVDALEKVANILVKFPSLEGAALRGAQYLCKTFGLNARLSKLLSNIFDKASKMQDCQNEVVGDEPSQDLQAKYNDAANAINAIDFDSLHADLAKTPSINQ